MYGNNLENVVMYFIVYIYTFVEKKNYNFNFNQGVNVFNQKVQNLYRS